MGNADELSRFRVALDASGDAILFVDPANSTVVDANRATCDALGYSRDHLLAAELRHILPQLDLADLVRAIDGETSGSPASALATTMRRQNGEELLVEMSVHRDESTSRPSLILLAKILSDPIGMRSDAAFCDPLTELPDRRVFERRLSRAAERAQRTGGRCAVLFVDLDNFKPINDRLGHAAGDHLLRACARRLSDCVRAGDLVSRYGGDEFTILLDSVECDADALAVAERVERAMQTPLETSGRRIVLSASIGIAFSGPGAADPESLLAAADRAMYRAKSAGGATSALFGEVIELVGRRHTA